MFFLLNQAGEIMNNPEALHSSGLGGGWDLAKTWKVMAALCAMWIISSDYTEVLVKESENEWRIFCWMKV